MAREEFEYRGRRISVVVFREDHRLGWEFRIDDEKPVGLKRSPTMDARLALAEAKSAARSVIDLRDGGA